jgi:hypothetical protein
LLVAVDEAEEVLEGSRDDAAKVRDDVVVLVQRACGRC